MASERATIQPLSPARYEVQFTVSAELCDKLERLRDLMPCSGHTGYLAEIDYGCQAMVARLGGVGRHPGRSQASPREPQVAVP